MTAVERFAKRRLAGRPRQHPLRRLEMHALDHLIVEPFSTAVERGHQPSGTLDLGLARRKRAVARCDLVGVDQALAVEAEPAPVLGFGEEALLVVERVE